MNIPLLRPSQQAHLQTLSPSHGQHNLFFFPYFLLSHPFPVLFIYPVFLHPCPSPVSSGPHFRHNEKEDRKDFSFLFKASYGTPPSVHQQPLALDLELLGPCQCFWLSVEV